MIGYLSEGNENTNSKRYPHPHVHAALFIIAKIWKQPKCPLMMDKWIKKMLHTQHTQTHTHTLWDWSQNTNRHSLLKNEIIVLLLHEKLNVQSDVCGRFGH